MRVNLRGEVLKHLVAVYERRVLTGAGGAIRADLFEGRGRTKALPKSGGFLAPSAAYLALRRDDANLNYGREDLLELALLAGDRLVVDHLDVGTPRHPKPNHFTIFPLAAAYELLAEHAGAKRRAAWRGAMERNLRAVDEMIDRCDTAFGRTHPWSGTGPNHFFGWLSVGYRQARVLEDEPLARRIERAMLRQLRVQSPGGYFPEHIGPAVLYQTVSLEGTAMFHHQRPRPESGEALERGVGFLVRAMYPDLRPIETFDERNRLHGAVAYGAFLVWTSEGRAVLRRVIEQRRAGLAKRDGQVDLWGLGHLHRVLEQAEAAGADGAVSVGALPFDKERAAWRIEDRGFVRKEGPWLYALSAWPDAVIVGNPYHLQRSQSLSIYHEQAGLIVGGGNDKFAPVNATVCIVEANECYYSPPKEVKLEVARPSRALRGGGRCDRLALDYGAAQATLEVAVESAQRLRVGVSAVSNMAGHEMWLTLQLPVTAPISFRSQGKAVRLAAAKEGQEPTGKALGRDLELPAKWRMRLPRGAQLYWPHLPWNPYAPPTYRNTPAGAVALLRVPLTAPGWSAEVAIEAV